MASTVAAAAAAAINNLDGGQFKVAMMMVVISSCPQLNTTKFTLEAIVQCYCKSIQARQTDTDRLHSSALLPFSYLLRLFLFNWHQDLMTAVAAANHSAYPPQFSPTFALNFLFSVD